MDCSAEKEIETTSTAGITQIRAKIRNMIFNRILALADILLKLCTSAASLFFLDIFFLLSNE